MKKKGQELVPKNKRGQEPGIETRTRELQERTRSTHKQTSTGVVHATKQGPRQRT